MTTEESIFAQAIALDSEKSRAAFLDQVCADNLPLRAEVEKLIQHYHQAGSFLENGPAQLDATLDARPESLEAGFAAAYGSNAAVVMGAAGHSVLKSLSKQLTSTPRVTLRDPPGEKGKVEQPTSQEVPKGENDSRYQLFGEIARGGMGAIIRGRDTDLGRDLAIKVLLDSQKDRPEAVQRFVEEAQIGGQLQHPGIAPIYELGQFSDQRPYFTMKLVKGETLAAILARRKDPKTEHAKLIGIFEQICQTMAYAHSKGVIHRDLKPANIMVGAFGEVQVMDWGLSKVLGAGGVADEKKSLDKHRDVSVIQTRRSTGSDGSGSVGSNTQKGTAMGTPAYMPPEQAIGEVDRLDERADVFGLGAILCEMLTGKPPYVAANATELMRMATRGKLDDCLARLDVSGAELELLQLTKQALSVEPEDRLRDAGEFASRITAHLEGVQERLKQAELARVEAQTRAEEERRRKKLYVAIAAMLVVGALGTTFALWQMNKKEQQRLAAQTEKNAAEADKKAAEDRAAYVKSVNEVSSMAARSEMLRPVFPGDSIALAINAVELSQKKLAGNILPIAKYSLYNSTVGMGGQLLYGRTCTGTHVAFSPDRRWLLAGWELWDLQNPHQSTGYSSRVLRRPSANKFYQIDVAFTPDSKTAITATSGVTQLWDLEDPAKLPVTLAGASLPQISPNGQWLATSIAGGKVKLWDLAANDPSQAAKVIPGELQQISCLKFSPQGRWLAAGTSSREIGLGKNVAVWDLQDMEQIPEPLLLRGHTRDVGCLVFGPKDRWLVSGSQDSTARVWDLTQEDPSKSPRVLSGHRREIMAIDFSGDGKLLATADQEIRLWRMDDSGPNPVPVVLEAHKDRVNKIAFSPDCRRLASAGHDFTARLWNLESEDIAESVSELRGHNARVWDLAFAPDSSLLATTDDDNTVRLWDATSTHPAAPRIPHTTEQPIHVVTFSPDGRWLAAASTDKQVMLWRFDHDGNATQPQLLSEDFSSIPVLPGLAVSDDSRRLAAVCGNQIQVWDLAAPNIVASKLELNGHVGLVRALAFSPDGQWLASTDANYAARLWDLTTAEPAADSILLLDQENSPIAVDFSPDGKWLAIGDYGQKLRIWDFPAVAKARRKLPPKHTVPCQGRIHGCEFTSNSRQVVAATKQGGLVVVDLSQKEQESHTFRQVPENQNVMALRVANGRAATVGWYPETFVWDIDDASQTQPKRIAGHLDNIEIAMAIDSTGRWLATGSKDETIRVADLDDPSAEPLVLQGGGGRVFAVAMSPDGRWLATGARQLRIWDLDVDRTLQRAKALVAERPEFEFASQAGAEFLAELQPSPSDSMIPIFDGETLNGWKVEGNEDWLVEDGCIVGRTGRLVYVKESFTNVEVALECQLNAGGNSGLFVRTPYLDSSDSWMLGYEAQITNLPGQICQTGGIYNFANFKQPLVGDDEWFTLNFRAVDNALSVFVNGQATTHCEDNTFTDGHVAFGTGRKTFVRFRNVRVRKF